MRVCIHAGASYRVEDNHRGEPPRLATCQAKKHVTDFQAGTSFGVSTIYLALAVSANTASGGTGRVIATENEPSKANIARQNWKEAGEEVERVIELREGDLRETLQVDLPTVDMLLLDSESKGRFGRRRWR